MQWSKLFKSVWIPTFGGLEKSRVTRFRDEHVIWLIYIPLSVTTVSTVHAKKKPIFLIWYVAHLEKLGYSVTPYLDPEFGVSNFQTNHLLHQVSSSFQCGLGGKNALLRSARQCYYHLMACSYNTKTNAPQKPKYKANRPAAKIGLSSNTVYTDTLFWCGKRHDKLLNFGFPFFFETAPENSPCCWQSAPWSNSDRDCSCPDGIVQRNLCWPAPQLISAPLGERGPIVLRLKQNRPGGNPAKALGVPGLEAQNSKVSVSNPSTISNCKGTGDNLPWNP